MSGWGYVAGAALGGAASAWSQNQANKENVKLTRETNQQNLQSAREQMAFQERMSATSYQRSMADMRAAGLNPMLAYSQGGASTPTGAAIAAQNPSVQAADFGKALEKGVSSAVDYKRYEKELKGVDSAKALNEAMIESQKSQRKLNEASAKVAERNAEATEAELPAIRAESKLNQKRANLDEKLVETDAVLNRSKNLTGTLSNVKDLLTPRINVGSPPNPNEVHYNHKGEITYESKNDPFYKRNSNLRNPFYRKR